MAESLSKKIVTLKSLTTEESLSFSGPNDFIVGLTADEKLTSCGRWSDNHQDVCLSLFNLTIWPTQGSTITPCTKDLQCIVGDDYIQSETNLPPGSKIEIGDKILEFIDGPLPSKRRQLPATPGVHIQSTPPSKPSRPIRSTDSTPEKMASPVHQLRTEDKGNDLELSDEWNLLHIPTMEKELINQLQTPEQIANLSASYLNRQINQHTDIKLQPLLVDQIFKTFQDVAVHRRDILESFLQDFSRELSITPDEEKGKPFHRPIISLLVEILKQFLDPPTHVLLCLQLLRAISHIPTNLYPLINYQTTAAVLGSMTAYLNIVDIQKYSLDILVKIATYKPDILEKPPLHEGGIEVISLAIQHHHTNLDIVQSGLRVLSNLSMTLYQTASQIIDDGCKCTEDVLESIDRYISILDALSWSCTSIIQEAMRNFNTDLNIKIEGRKFMYVYAQLPHLKQRKTQWYEQCLEMALNQQLEYKEQQEPGILKRRFSYEMLRSPERRVKFIEDEDEDDLLSSIASSVIKNSNEDDGSIEIASRIFYDPHSGKPLNGAVDSSINGAVDSSINGAVDSSINADITLVNGNNNYTDIPFVKNDKKNKRGWNYIENIVIDFDKMNKSDIVLMTKLLKTVVVSEVCSQAFNGEEPAALKLLDQPMNKIVAKHHDISSLKEFIRSQFREEITLMDFDPTVAVALIDAVRYRSVGYELLQGSIKSTVKLFDEDTDSQVLRLCCYIVIELLNTENLKPALHDSIFYEDLKKYLLSAVSKVEPGSAVDDVITHVLKQNIQLQLKSSPI